MSKALEVATQNPDFLPRSFDLDELVEDTVMEVGSEAYAAALMVYNFAKVNGTGSGLDGVVDEMGKRFARKSNSKNKVGNLGI